MASGLPKVKVQVPGTGPVAEVTEISKFQPCPQG